MLIKPDSKTTYYNCASQSLLTKASKYTLAFSRELPTWYWQVWPLLKQTCIVLLARWYIVHIILWLRGVPKPLLDNITKVNLISRLQARHRCTLG